MGNCVRKSRPPRQIDPPDNVSVASTADDFKKRISSRESMVERYKRDPTENFQKRRPPVPEPIQVDPDPSLEGKKIFRAMYDYSAVEHGDLSFVKGDLMEILQNDGEWWIAVHLKTKLSGYIPSTYIAVYNSLERYDWFHGDINRKQAEQRLLAPGHIRGTYLIRGRSNNNDTASPKTQYNVLSVLDIQFTDGEEAKTVKHYRITVLDSGKCFLSTKLQCESVQELVERYKVEQGCLCCCLERPCPKSKPVLYDMSHNTRDHWQIDRHTLTFGERIGTGEYGAVHKGKWHTTDVTIKVLKVGNPDTKKFLEEAAVMKTLRHPKLVTLYAVCYDEQPFYLVTEYMCNGNLLDYLRKDGGRTLKPNNLIHIGSQVAQGMVYMHNSDVIHRDLAARNILVGEHEEVKIGDFGMSKLVDSISSEPQDTISEHLLKWASPEAIRSGQFSTKSDVWSFGVLLIELFSYGATPYSSLPNKISAILVEISRGYRHPPPSNCPENVYEVMLYCWKLKPVDRPTFEHLADRLENLIDYAGDYQET